MWCFSTPSHDVPMHNARTIVFHMYIYAYNRGVATVPFRGRKNARGVEVFRFGVKKAGRGRRIIYIYLYTYTYTYTMHIYIYTLCCHTRSKSFSLQVLRINKFLYA